MERRFTSLINKATSRFKQEFTIPEAYQDELESIRPVIESYASLLQGTTVVKIERFYGEEHPLIELMRNERRGDKVLLSTRLMHAVEEIEDGDEEREQDVLRITAEISDSQIQPESLFHSFVDTIKTERMPVINIFDLVKDTELPVLQWTPQIGIIEYQTLYEESEL